MPAHALNAYTDRDEDYKESIFVGYRWYDMEKLESRKANSQFSIFNSQFSILNSQFSNLPLFPFGHGLSYTTFGYSKPRLSSSVITSADSLTVSVDITNTGTVEGKEVVQLYISDLESRLPRPVKELKGFRKVSLAPGETRTVMFTIGRDALSYFDPDSHTWVAEPGKFEAIVASSSRDIRGKAQFKLKGD